MTVQISNIVKIFDAKLLTKLTVIEAEFFYDSRFRIVMGEVDFVTGFRSFTLMVQATFKVLPRQKPSPKFLPTNHPRPLPRIIRQNTVLAVHAASSNIGTYKIVYKILQFPMSIL
jgi:hypothetical protein